MVTPKSDGLFESLMLSLYVCFVTLNRLHCDIAAIYTKLTTKHEQLRRRVIKISSVSKGMSLQRRTARTKNKQVYVEFNNNICVAIKCAAIK